MKKFFLLSVVCFLLTSCGSRWTETPVVNPYPTLPLDATGITLAPGEGENYKAIGTEPFWNADITATGVSFSRPDESGISMKNYETRQEERDGILVIKDAKWEFFITLKKWECNDGMSDKRYYFTANIALGNENLKGCANKD
jgi:uncharacterized membrane protein